MSPKISVVVPVYNTQEYLCRCLDSILCQTLQDIEIIVVNDLTADCSQEIIDEYQKRDHRVSSVLHTENRGLGGARNSGVAAARSPYIQFVDSDDYIHPEMCAQLYELAEATGAGLVHCGCSLIYSTAISDDVIAGDREYYRITKEGLDLVTDSLPSNADVASWNKLFRRELLEQYQLRFPEKMLYEDAYFAMAYWSICGSVCYHPEALYFYDRKAGSIMTETFAGNQGLKVLDHLHIVHLFYDFLQRHGLFIRYQKSFWKFYTMYLDLGFRLAGSGEVYKGAFQLAHDFLQGKGTVEDAVLQAVQNLDYPEYVWQELQRTQRDREQVQNNRWYRFGRLSRKRKFWIMGTWLARRLCLYPILRPFSAFLRRHKI
ncbi:glycosyltransferase family 2 protein [Candidatus Haliotispira prima]|uniref:Glycosyltransferase family 2 protein n=1 Tax=Candidatus Haliotispira prima TaxID=3034016 RepID=A0ABY8MGT5_9SPIO|nr:glycosyltransferase family 2 protein [Candidatus Haliotispira prima]